MPAPERAEGSFGGLQRLPRRVPGGLALLPRLRSRPRRGLPRLGGERRQLTVLFHGLVGSTEFSASLDPEDYRALLRGYQAQADQLVQGFGGHVAQHLGDGLLVYFGWPRAFDDAAERAVHAGLAPVDGLAPHPALHVRVDSTPVPWW